MKKSLLHVAFAALLLVGCAQNEITDISPDAAPPVGFKVFTDAQTRGLITNGGASSVNATGIQSTGFGRVCLLHRAEHVGFSGCKHRT